MATPIQTNATMVAHFTSALFGSALGYNDNRSFIKELNTYGVNKTFNKHFNDTFGNNSTTTPTLLAATIVKNLLGADTAYGALKTSLTKYLVTAVSANVIKSGTAGQVIEAFLIKFAVGGFGTQPAAALWNKTIASNVTYSTSKLAATVAQAPLALSPTPAQVTAKANFDLQAAIVAADATAVATAKDAAAAALAIVISANPATLAEKASQLAAAQAALILTKASLAAALKQNDDVKVLIADAKLESKAGSAIDLPTALAAAAAAAADITAATAAMNTAETNLNIATASIVGELATLSDSTTTGGAQAVYLADAAQLAEDAVNATLGNINAKALLDDAQDDALTTVALATVAVTHANSAVAAANAAVTLANAEKVEAAEGLASAAKVLTLAATATNLLGTELALAKAQVATATEASTVATIDSAAAAALLASATAQLLVAQVALTALTPIVYTNNSTSGTWTTGVQVGAGNLVLNDINNTATATDIISVPNGAVIAATSLTVNGGSSTTPAFDAITANLATTAWASLQSVTVNGLAADIIAVNTGVDVFDNAGTASTVDGARNVTVKANGVILVGNTNAVTGIVNVTDVYQGNTTGAIAVVGGTTQTVTGNGNVTLTKATGAIIVTEGSTDSLVGPTISATGGTTVNVNVLAAVTNSGVFMSLIAPTTAGSIAVGAAPTFAVAPSAILPTVMTNVAPTGNVVINEATLAKALSTSTAQNTNYGKAVSTVYVNGASSVSISGGTVSAQTINAYVNGQYSSTTGGIVDIQTNKLAANNADAVGVAGTSKLTSVTLAGVSGPVGIASNVLSTVTINDSQPAGGNYGQIAVTAVTVNEVPAHVLNLVLSNTALNTAVTDNSATSFVVSTGAATLNGKADSFININGTKATSETFNNAGTVNVPVHAANITTINANNTGTLNLGTVANTVTTVNASAATGKTTATLGTATAYTGGTGVSVVTVAAASTVALNGGSNAASELILSNFGAITALTTAAKIGTLATNFPVLGFAGTTTGVVDLSKVSGFTGYDIWSLGSGNLTLINAVVAAPLLIQASNNIIVLQTAGTTGASNIANVTLGTVTNTGSITVSNLTLMDSVYTGTGTVNVTSNYATDANGMNSVVALNDTALSTLNINGTAGFQTMLANTSTAASMIINNTTTGNATSYLYGLINNALTSLTFNGSNSTSINVLTSTSTALTITDNDTKAVQINTLVDTALTSLTLTNTVNTTAATFAINGAFTGTNLATLNLNGNVGVIVNGNTLTTAFTVAGASDHARVVFYATGATAAGVTQSVTLGNGAGDDVILGAGVAATLTTAASTQTVVLGTGAGDSVTSASQGIVNVTVGGHITTADTITLSGVGVTANVTTGSGPDLATAADTNITIAGAGAKITVNGGLFGAANLLAAGGGDTIVYTAGNSNNTVIANSAVVNGDTVTISVGTGANTIRLGASDKGTVTFGAHTAATVDAITIGASGTSITDIVKIAGLNNTGADTLTFGGDVIASINATAVTSANVIAVTGDATNLASWIATADGLIGAGGVSLAAHSANWFTFGGNTYIVESAAVGNGTLTANDTVVELIGTGYTFNNASITLGVLTLQG